MQVHANCWVPKLKKTWDLEQILDFGKITLAKSYDFELRTIKVLKFLENWNVVFGRKERDLVSRLSVTLHFHTGSY